MSATHDDDIANVLTNRYIQKSISTCAKGDIKDFTNCEDFYFKFFLLRNIEELKEMMTIIPKGSLIFHGTPCKSTKDYPSPTPYTYNTNLSGVQHVLSEETIQKTIGTIAFKMKEEVEAEVDPNIQSDIRAKYAQQISEYRARINDAMSKGISVGKSFFWVNTTVDANVMVDVRLMKSMIAFVAKRDIILLNYFKVNKLFEANMASYLQLFINHLLTTPKIPGTINDTMYNDLIAIFDRNELEEMVKDKDKLLHKIKTLRPDIYYYLLSHTTFIFKRAITMPKEVTRDEDVIDEFAQGRWTSVISPDTDIELILRNKYKDTIGDSTLIQLLNYLLSLKGWFRISGYADYDIADKTNSDILPGTNICGALNGGNHVCKEIMLLDPSKYLTYLGSCEINQFDTKAVDSTDNLNLAKQQMWTILSNKLNRLIKKDETTFIKLRWATMPDDINPELFNVGGIYENITIFPHYRFDTLSSSQIDSLVQNIEDDTLSIVSINDKRRSVPHTVFGPYGLSSGLSGGSRNSFIKTQIGGMKMDDDNNKVELAHILEELKLLSPNTSGHVYSADVYMALYKYVESMNPALVEPDESKELTDEQRDEKKYKIKTDISDVITKCLHKDNEIHQFCIDELKRICNVVKIDISTKTSKIQEIYDDLMGDEFDQIRNGVEPIFFFYLKGSSALNLLVNGEKKYAQIINKSKIMTDLMIKSELNTSDFDINVCINPIIMKSSKRTKVKNMVLNYFRNLLTVSRDRMVAQIFTREKIRDIFAKVNKTLLQQAHDPSDLPMNVVVGDMHYVLPKYEQDDVTEKKKKYTIAESPIGIVKISQIDVSDTKLNNFSLLRLKLIGTSGRHHLNCHGELLDISIIDDMDEAEFTWPHHNNIVTINGIHVNDLKGLCLDLNNTLLNNLVAMNKNKSMKRFIRLDFVHKLLCQTLNSNDEFFRSIRDVAHDVLSKKTYCANDNNIMNLVTALRLWAISNIDNESLDLNIESTSSMSVLDGSISVNPDIIPASIPNVVESLKTLAQDIESHTTMDQIDVDAMIHDVDSLLDHQLADVKPNVKSVNAKTKNPVSPSNDFFDFQDSKLKSHNPKIDYDTTARLMQQSSDQTSNRSSDRSSQQSERVKVPSSSDIVLKHTTVREKINKLKLAKFTRQDLNKKTTLMRKLRNTNVMMTYINDMDIKKYIEGNTLSNTIINIDTSNAMYMLLALKYGQIDFINKMVLSKEVNDIKEILFKTVTVLDEVAMMIGYVGKKIFDLISRHDLGSPMYQRYMSQPSTIMSSFTPKSFKTAHKIQSIINTDKFTQELTFMVRTKLKLRQNPIIYRKISNKDYIKTDGMGDNFIKITNSYFAKIQGVNVQLFNYQIVINTSNSDEFIHSNQWQTMDRQVVLNGGRVSSILSDTLTLPSSDSALILPGVKSRNMFDSDKILPRKFLPNTTIQNLLIHDDTSSQKQKKQEHSIAVVPEYEELKDFSAHYEPSGANNVYALAIFFPNEIPDELYTSVQEILLGDFLSTVPEITDDSKSKDIDYLDKIEFPKTTVSHIGGIGSSVVFTTKSTRSAKSVYVDNKRSYMRLTAQY